MTMVFADTTINRGGLLRCEKETIDAYKLEHIDEPVPDKPLIIACRYCSGRPLNIILEDGVWRWNVATEE